MATKEELKQQHTKETDIRRHSQEIEQLNIQYSSWTKLEKLKHKNKMAQLEKKLEIAMASCQCPKNEEESN